MELIIFAGLNFFNLFLIMFEKKKKENIFYLYVFILLFVIANRSDIFPDTQAYRQEYLNNIYILQNRYEFLFNFFSGLLRRYVENPKVYFFLISLIIYTLIVKLSRKILTNSLIALLLFNSYFGFYTNLVVIRVGLALALGYFIIFKKISLLKKICFLIIPVLFHKSAVIFYLILFISKKKYTPKTYCCIFIVSIVIYILRIGNYVLFSFFSFLKKFNYYTYYLDNIQFNSSYSIKFLFWVLLGIIMINFKSKKKEISYAYNIYIAGIFIYSILGNFLFVERITDYFFYIQFIVLTEKIQEEKLKIIKLIYIIFIVVINLIFLVRFIKLY